jgi:pimeloyl-ACP methyl ester carboxylesterase
METTIVSGSDLFITVNGTKICYDDFGKGLEPIIFLHGFPFDKSAWKPQVAFLKNTSRVIAIDIRGFGKSNAGTEKMSINLFADDLIQFMDAIEIKTAIVCGLSMGGFILLNAAKRFPERFTALIFADTQCIADTPEVKEGRAKTIAQIEKEGIEKFAEYFLQAVFHPHTIDNERGLVENIRGIIKNNSPEIIIGGLQALASRDETCTTLNKIDVPTLILCGKQDTVTPATQSEFLNKNIKNSFIHLIDNAGHLSNLEKADEFNHYLSYFVHDMVK